MWVYIATVFREVNRPQLLSCTDAELDVMFRDLRARYISTETVTEAADNCTEFLEDDDTLSSFEEQETTVVRKHGPMAIVATPYTTWMYFFVTEDEFYEVWSGPFDSDFEALPGCLCGCNDD